VRMLSGSAFQLAGLGRSLKTHFYKLAFLS